MVTKKGILYLESPVHPVSLRRLSACYGEQQAILRWIVDQQSFLGLVGGNAGGIEAGDHLVERFLIWQYDREIAQP